MNDLELVKLQARYNSLAQVLRDLIELSEPGASAAVQAACRIAREALDVPTSGTKPAKR